MDKQSSNIIFTNVHNNTITVDIHVHNAYFVGLILTVCP